MARRKQGNSHQVTYRSTDGTIITESFRTEEEAIIREAQVKLAKKNGTFEPPVRMEKGKFQRKKDITVEDFLNEYVEVYGLKKWGNSFHDMNLSLIRNYVVPYIGQRYVRSLTVRDMDAYYTMLLDQPAVVVQGHHDTGAKVTASTVGRIHKLLKSAFSKAVAWEYMPSNPIIGATLPEVKSAKRDVWSDDEVIHVLSVCDDPVLRICLYLALGCSMRLGEILGLQWANVHMEPAANEAYLVIDRELKRCSNASIEALERVNRSTIILKFPPVMPKKGTTTLVLKAPKTESSNRTIYLPNAVAEELRHVKAQQEEYKQLMGEEYRDDDLVVAQMNGHPYEQRIIDKKLYKLIEDHDLRPVVFHSLRHSSTSLKLKLSRGNIKAVQGDTGHAEARMVTDTYAHGFDADRKLIAQEMDSGFFSKVGVQNAGGDPDEAVMEQIKKLIHARPDLLTKLLAEADSDQPGAPKNS